MTDDRVDISAQVANDDLAKEVARLALLTPHGYETERKAAASRLKVRVAYLDEIVQSARPCDPKQDDVSGNTVKVEEIVPWPDPVDGASLAEEIRKRLIAHVVFSTPGDANTATLWILGSYLMDTWRLWPRLMITSPTKQCGKSTLLEVLDAMVHRGLIISNSKSAGIFRAIEAWQPTLLMDEADTWMKDDQELTGILNSGHTRRTATVLRVQEKNREHVPTLFRTWCPMVIAGIGSQRDTLTSRSILIGLRRKLPSEKVQRVPPELHANSAGLRRQIARWAADNCIRLGNMTSEPPDCGNDRRLDNFAPLWRIAEVLGGVWPVRIASAYAASSKIEEADAPAAILLLRDLKSIFDGRESEKLQTAELVGALVAMEERPWAEWKNGQQLSPQTIAKLMKPFDIRPRDVRTEGHVLKSYLRSEVEAAFERYVQS